jgi:ferredoxin-fold anticodon binding domain-containing protein
MQGKHAIIRTYSAGVHAGTVKSINGKEVVLTDARRLWYWNGAFTLNAVANEAIEIIPTSEAAQKNLTEFKTHTP